MRNYYQVGLTLHPASLATKMKAYEDRIKKAIRDEAAKGAAPAAKRSVTPIVLGAVGLSVVSLAIALRK